jgi:iron(III) transport system permease protein
MTTAASRPTLNSQLRSIKAPRFSWLWLPGLMVALGLLLPLIYLAVRGFSADEQVWTWLMRVQTLELVGRSLGLAGAVSLAAIILAVPLAWLVTRSDLPGRRFWSALIPLPLVIPSYVGAYLFVSAFGPRGLLQSVLEQLFGVQRLPDIYGFWGALWVLTLMTYPFIFLTVRAALQRSDRAVEEAARSLGNTAWQTFWRAVFPLLRPAIAAGSLLTALYVLRDFGAVSIMRYTTFTRAIYIQYQSSFDRTGAALLALVLVVVTIVVLVFEQRLSAGQNISSPQTYKPPALIKLGHWRLPALLFINLVLLVALALPAGLLGYWLVRGMASGEQIAGWFGPLTNSILAAGLGSVAALIAALPVAILAVRQPGKASTLLERFSYIGYALPGVVIALALVFFGANFLPWAYQTLAMLVFAYVILFLPQAVGSVRTSLLQVHKNVEEAGHSLGAGKLRVFTRVTLPLVWPGVASGMALIFLTVMKELPATLILSPTGFPTLATQIWSSVSEAFFARAALPALLIILISSVPLALLNLYSTKRGPTHTQ